MRTTFKFVGVLLLYVSYALSVGCKEDDTVYQAADDVSARVSVEQTGATGGDNINVSIVPNNYVKRIEIAISDKQGDRESFRNNTMNGVVVINDINNPSYEFSGLEPRTVYYIFARGFNKQGEAGPMAEIMTSTTSGQFTVTKQFVSPESAAFTLEITAEFRRYDYALCTPATKQEFISGGTEADGFQDNVPSYTVNYPELKAETDYVFVARGYNRYGETEIIEYPFTTPAAEDVPYVEINFKSVDVYKTDIEFTPNKRVGKYAILTFQRGSTTFGGWEDKMGSLRYYHGDELATLSDAVSASNADLNIQKTQYNFINIMPKVETNCLYDLYILVYDSQARPSCVLHRTYDTPAFDESLPVVSINNVTVSTKTTAKVDFSIEAGTNCFGVFYGVYHADTADNRFTRDESYQNEMVTKGTFVYMKDSANPFSASAVKAMKYALSNLEPNTRYYVIAYPVNSNGNGWYDRSIGAFLTGFGKLTKYEFTTDAQ